MQLRTKTALLGAVATVALIVVSAWAILRIAERETRQLLTLQRQELAGRVADEIAQKTALRHRALVAAASKLPARTERETVAEFLEARPALATLFSELVIWSVDGEVLAGIPGRVGMREPDHEALQTTLLTRRPALSDPLIDKFISEPILILTAPVFDKRANVALVLGGIVRLQDPEFLGDLARKPVGRSGFLVLATGTGQILMHPVRRRIMERLDAEGRSSMAPAFDGVRSLTEETAAFGVPALVSYAPVRNSEWTLAAVLPLSEANAPLAGMRQGVAAIALLLVIAVPLLAWVLTWYLMRPVTVLRHAIAAMRDDPDADVHVVVNRRDELGELAASFNALTAARRQAEKSLRDEHRLLQTVFDTVESSLWVKDRDGTILMANRAAELRWDVPKGGLVGLPQWPAHSDPVFLEAISRADREVIASGEASSALVAATLPDGSEHFLSRNLHPLIDECGMTVGVVGYVSDVTEFKRTEAALRRLSQVVEQNPVSIMITDLHGLIEYVNPKFCEVTGYGAEEVIGRKPSILKGGDTPPGVYRHLWETITAGREWAGEFHSRRKSGELFWESVRVLPMRDANGTITHYVGVKEDITARKNIEREIAELNQSLEQRVARRTAELQAVNQELEAFSYSVSHDLRAPLRAIDGYSAIILEQCMDRFSEEERHLIGRVRANAQHMAQLIDYLLGLARVSRAEIRQEEINLSALAAEIAHGLSEAEPNRQVAIVIAQDLHCVGDASLVRIALENLLGNAFKYTRKKESARIEFGATRQDGETVYFVADDGAGFDMAYARKLFGAFQRMHAASEFEGSGVGLASVKRIVTRHGGRIWAESAKDRGATFYFTLGT